MNDRVLLKLIARVRKNRGDRVAWDQLLQWLIPRLTGVLKKRLIQDTDVRDVVQETYLCMFQGCHTLRGNDPKQFERWARQIARNCVVEFFRKRDRLAGGPARRIPADDDETLAIPTPGPDLAAQVDARLVLPHVNGFVNDHPSSLEQARQVFGNGEAPNGATKKPMTGTERSKKSMFLSALRAHLANLGVTWGDDE